MMGLSVFELMESYNISFEEAIKNDWRNTGDWQPGWEYDISDIDK